MNDRIRDVTRELSKITAEARERFGALSAEQLGWKPSAKGWSVAQCLDHLITTHSLYLPLFKRLQAGDVAPSLWQRISPFSGLFGRLLINSMRPENRKKTKTIRRAEPSGGEADERIVEKFAEHQEELIDHLRKLPPSLDPVKTTITSPLLGLVTYSLDDCFTIFVVHGQRHLGQATRVMEAEGFPAATANRRVAKASRAHLGSAW